MLGLHSVPRRNQTQPPSLFFLVQISSTSNCTDYQSRRLLIRHKTPTGTSFAHTLNGTAAAIPRLLVALIENGARFEGEEVVGVDLPISLKRFWLGGEEEDRIRWV